MDVSVLIAFFQISTARAYNPLTHEQITRSAVSYLKTHEPKLPEATKWLATPDFWFAEETLVRGAVDADFRTDVWLDGWFHSPFVGASSGGNSSIFTSFLHFISTNSKGDYWEYDGYAYRHSSRKGFDKYLATPSATIKGSLSSVLGGRNDAHPEHGAPLGTLDFGFKGSKKDWQNLFYGSNDGEDAVFPPASVPVEAAFSAIVKTGRSAQTHTESWHESLPMVTGLTSGTTWQRDYWRGEVNQLPAAFDLLGYAFHFFQDVTVPQHAQGTCDWCHQELESAIDMLVCNVSKSPDGKKYRDGTYNNDFPQCQYLYDAALVDRLLAEVDEFDLAKSYTLTQRIFRLAERSARWQWGDPDDSVDFIGTVLPDGREFTADRCSDLVKLREVKEQAKYQYNLAVAATVVAFELAASKYERAHEALGARVLRLFDFFRLR